MSKFKPGDHIEVVETDEADEKLGIEVGTRGYILDVSAYPFVNFVDNCTDIEECEEYAKNNELYRHYMSENQLKLVEEKKMNKIEKHKEICNELNTLYERKNNDYGDSFAKSFEEYGMIMSCIRLEDKLNRLKSLSRDKEQMVKDESLIDTLMDLANYSIMTIIELEGGKINE